MDWTTTVKLKEAREKLNMLNMSGIHQDQGIVDCLELVIECLELLSKESTGRNWEGIQ